MRKIAFLLVGFVVASMAKAQDERQVRVLTLDECIEIALSNNLDIKRAGNNELIARSNNLQSLMQFLPSINAGINWDISVGNQFDNNTGQVVNVSTQRSNPSVSANWVVFQGLSNFHQRKQRENELISAEMNKDNSELNTEASILSFYLNVILSEENIKIAQQRVDLLTAQLDREVKRESVGVGNLESVYNFRSQLANEQLNLINFQNTFRRNKLQLLQAMQLDPTEYDYKVEPYPLADSVILSEPDIFARVLDEAMNYNPSVKAAEAGRRASLYQYRAAQGLRLPTISVLGVYGSNYSSNGAFNPETDDFETDATFFEQLGYNEFQFLRFDLNLPLFTRFNNHNRIQTAKLALANAELDNEQARLNVTNTVQTVYLDLINAQATYRSAHENLESLKQSFDFMQKRFETGNSDFYTYLESLNNKNRAEIELSNAKYSIALRKRILELYRGLQTTPY